MASSTSISEAHPSRLLFIRATGVDDDGAEPGEIVTLDHGQACCRVVSSLEAVQSIDLSGVDAVVCDVALPDDTALRAVAHLRQQRPDLPVLVAGDPRDVDVIVETIQAGAAGFLSNGPHLDTIPAMIHSCLAHLRVARENEQLQRDLNASQAREEITQQEFESVIQQLQTMARTDELTGLANRRWLNIMLTGAWAEAIRHDLPLAFLMIDLDGFKTLNDRLGHQRGDEVLRLAGRVIDANCRDVDTSARYGGDEFCVLMPHTEPSDALAVGGRIIGAFEEAVSGRPDDEPRAGMSIGLAHLHLSRPVNADQLLMHADEALYAAKALGKNRVVARERDGVYVPMSRG